MTATDDAFRWARIYAVRHMAACELAGLRWGETSITEIVTAQASWAVTVVPFTQQAEARSGADWVWWWTDGAGAYGMLVQAKRMTVAQSKWNFGFSYKMRGARRTQREVLLSAAASLGLLPVYALYLGTGNYRGWERCSENHQSGRCLQCVKRAVSLMPALLAEELVVDDAVSTYERSVALEELWTPPKSGALLLPALEKKLAPELADFLRNEQTGTRAVTRKMMDRILQARAGAFGAPTVAVNPSRIGDHDRLGPVFEDLPDDYGHWGLNYFEHTLNPLRRVPPGYVLEIASGDFDEDRLAADMPDNVAGIVVAEVPNSESE
jgi:hypothetical protein